MGRRAVDFNIRLICKIPNYGKAGECWVWPGATVNGRGVMTVNGKPHMVHRLTYEKFVGLIPEGFQLSNRMSCDEPRCCNPEHYETVPFGIEDPVAHFWAGVDQSGGQDACWPWTRSLAQATGYGQYNTKGQMWSTHVYAWVQENGPVPDGMTIDHQCHNDDPGCPPGLCPHRACCNPAHLRAVSNKTNTLAGKGLTAANSRKTHCKNGHEFTEENTILVPRDRGARVERWCRTCHLDKQYLARHGVPRPRAEGQVLMDDPRERDSSGRFC